MFKKSSNLYLIIVLLSVILLVNYVNAITSSVIKSTVRADRYRVTFTDVINGTSIPFPGGGVGFCKKITLYTMGLQDQIVSFVSNLTTRFRVPNPNSNVYVNSIRPERAGVDLTGLDIAMPPQLNDVINIPNLETRFGNAAQYSFFSEGLTTDVVLTVCGDESLATLTQGQIDFYVLKVE